MRHAVATWNSVNAKYAVPEICFQEKVKTRFAGHTATEDLIGTKTTKLGS